MENKLYPLICVRMFNDLTDMSCECLGIYKNYDDAVSAKQLQVNKDIEEDIYEIDDIQYDHTDETRIRTNESTWLYSVTPLNEII